MQLAQHRRWNGRIDEIVTTEWLYLREYIMESTRFGLVPCFMFHVSCSVLRQMECERTNVAGDECNVCVNVFVQFFFKKMIFIKKLIF